MANIVDILQGRISGIEEEGVLAFRGVPFAAPPIGVRRFRAPAPPESWSGVRPADQSAPAAWQMNRGNLEKVQGIVQSFGDVFPGVRLAPPFVASTYFQPSISEDCLYLDIWVPTGRGAELPVYLYYHGGANAGSSGSAWLERGAALAREEGVIVVRPSYRLGALGWVHFGLVSEALGEAVNLGLQDQIAALRWVSENIERFGGDPNNITVGGESAGGTAVSHLMTNPDTRRLFRRAVIQSLSPFNQWCTQTRQDAVSIVEIYLQILGLADVAEIETTDPDRLLAVSQALQRFFEADKNCAWRPLGAVVDGASVPQQPAIFLSEGELAPQEMDVMIGFAKDEWQFFRGHSETLRSASKEDFIAALAQVSDHDAAAGLYGAYAAAYPDRSPAHLLGDAMSFEFFKLSSLKIADNLSRRGVNTRLFQFSYDLPGQGGSVRAFHTGDMPFIWRNHTPDELARWPAFEGIDHQQMEASATTFGRLYGAFIRTGDPGPHWPRYGADNKTILWFGETVEARSGLLSAEERAFEAAGLVDVRTLEAQLAHNTRQALNTPARAYAAARR